ncbi:MAG: hypothetical protein ABII64_03265 [Elusimicrobiota bacterium]
MNKIWIHKANSFENAKNFEKRKDLSLTPSQRLSNLQFLREEYFKFRGLNESRKRLRRVIKVIKQA